MILVMQYLIFHHVLRPLQRLASHIFQLSYKRKVFIKIMRIVTSQIAKAFRNLKGGDRRVRIFSAHNNWWATPEVRLPLPSIS